MSETESTVFVVDDDHAVRRSLEMLIRSVGLRVQTFSSAQEFLDGYDPDTPGCLVLDVRMPRISGLELQQTLTEKRIDIPVIIVTGHGDVPIAVRALRNGAVDFLEKPYSDQVLLERVNEALQSDLKNRSRKAQHTQVTDRLGQLTHREREVIELITSGMSNKEAAAALGVSRKTVEVHRAHIMEKMKVDSLAELVEAMTRIKLAPQPAEVAAR
jgi:two-component system, LuxR family, response regulator FixJ